MKNIFIALLFVGLLASCSKTEQAPAEKEVESESVLKERINIYAPTVIQADISHLTDNQKKVVQLLTEAGKIADEIFWKQTSPDAIPLRDSLMKLNTPEAKEALEFVKINYGPYDLNEEGKRYIGQGPAKKPAVANFYPQDLTKEEFEAYIKAHPEQEAELKSLYTIVVRDGENLKAIPYHEAYPAMHKIADKLMEAAQYADNPTLKTYLELRSEALRTDNYYDSDMAWMDIKDNDIDVVIGPIESYEDGLYNYKTAFEAVVFVRDIEASQQLQMYREYINEFEQALPYDQKYIRKNVGGGHHILNIVNVAYFGGDCQAGTKTIACNLPNDPAVRKVKGGKNSMYKNMMEAKFEQIVVPIGAEILDPALVDFIDSRAFMSFVTLHEVSHTLGRDYVFGNDELSVRTALKERYSPIEETKADILSMYNHKQLIDKGVYNAEYGKRAIATYIPGLFRSIRFGAEEAHGRANLVQFNFLRKNGAITLDENGKYNIDETKFFDVVADLAALVLTTEAEGNYDKAGEILDTYGKMTPETKTIIDRLVAIPRDINTTYETILTR